MNTTKIAGVVKNLRSAASKHSPEILTGLGIAGMVTTTVLAVKATPKALKLIEAKKKEERKDELTAAETVQTTWRCYLPAAVTGAISVTCLVGASRVSLRRNAALATAYKLSETALTEYKEKVVDTLGEKKEKNIRDSISKDRVEKKPIKNNEVMVTGKGTTRCLDSLSGRYFNSDIDIIKKAENELNRRMRSDMYISLNEFYDELGLSHISVGDDLGWNIDRGYIEIDFSSQLCDDGIPCIVLDYQVAPQYDYDKLY